MRTGLGLEKRKRYGCVAPESLHKDTKDIIERMGAVDGTSKTIAREIIDALTRKQKGEVEVVQSIQEKVHMLQTRSMRTVMEVSKTSKAFCGTWEGRVSSGFQGTPTLSLTRRRPLLSSKKKKMA